MGTGTSKIQPVPILRGPHTKVDRPRSRSGLLAILVCGNHPLLNRYYAAGRESTMMSGRKPDRDIRTKKDMAT